MSINNERDDFGGALYHHQEERLATSHQNGIVCSEKALVATKKRMNSFLTKHGSNFVNWWIRQSLIERETFIQDVYPTLVYSLEDRWCYGTTDEQVNKTQKEYSTRYDQLLLRIPQFTVQYFAADNNFPLLVRKWCEPNSLLKISSSMIVELRRLPGYESHSFTKGGYAVKLLPISPNNDDEDRDNHDFSNPYMQVNDPHIARYGSGQVSSPVGTTLNLYDLGAIATVEEFHDVRHAMVTLQHLMASLLDEYREEVLGKNCVDSIVNPMMQCLICGSTKSLMRCKQCGSAWYCGKEHQKEHWSQHKSFCKLFKKKQSPKSKK